MLRKITGPLCRFPVLSRKDLILSCASAFLLTLSFPVFNLKFLAWAAFVPLFAALENKTRAQAFVLAYISGAAFWLGTIYWLVHVTAAGMFILVLYLALYWGVFGLLVSRDRAMHRGTSVFFIPALWVVLEYCRSHALTGFPWALTAYTQTRSPALIQVSDITGAWGVSFLVMMVNAAFYTAFYHWRHERIFRKSPLILAGCLFLAVYVYGVMRMCAFSARHEHEKNIKVSVVQGNIPQELKWKIEARDYIMQTYADISREAAEGSPDLIVWPEAAVPAAVSEGSEYHRGLQRLAESLRTNLLLGAVTYRDDGYYNSAVLFRPGGAPEQYDKIHLVPFGEYVPLPGVFGFLQTIVPIGEVRHGSDYHVFRVSAQRPGSDVAFSSLICYEDMFPEISRRTVRRGADLLITVTNDAWYGRTSAPYQHFQAAVFRAVENRVWMVRSANTGVSGFVSPDGIVDGLVSGEGGRTIFVPGFLTRMTRFSAGRTTLYTRWGDWFAAAAFFMAILNGLVPRLLRGARRRR